MSGSTATSPSGSGWCDYLFLWRLIRALSLVALVGIVAANVMGLLETAREDGQNINIATYFFNVVFALLLMLAVMEWPRSVKNMFGFLGTWLGVGLGLLYLGLLSLATFNCTPFNDTEQTAMEVLGWIMVSMGLLYILMGAMGGQRIRDYRQQTQF